MNPTEMDINHNSKHNSKDSMSISLLICTYNRSEIVCECLSSLLRMNDPGCPFEVIVIDNNSKDDTNKKVNEFIKANPRLNIQIYKEIRQGLSFARNLAAHKAKGDLLVFLDDDAIVDKNYLLSYKKHFKQNNLRCMGSKILPWYRQDEVKIPSWFNKTNWGLLSMLDMGDMTKEVKYPNFPYGGNLAVAKSLFLKYGFFDENMGRKGKSLNSNMEIEFMDRLQKSDIQIYYVPDAIIYHLIQPERLNCIFFFRRFYAQGRSDVYLFNKENGIKFIIDTIPVRLRELIYAPFLYIRRKRLKKENYFKSILRSFYNIGFFTETLLLILKSSKYKQE